MLKKYLFLFLICVLSINNLVFAQSYVIKNPQSFVPMAQAVADYLKPQAAIAVRINIDSVQVKGGKINIWFSKLMSDYAFREDNINTIEKIVNDNMPLEYKGKTPVLFANGSTLKELSSKFYASETIKKENKKKKNSQPQLVTNMSLPYKINDALEGKHLAIWQSHGFYYNQA